MEGKRGRVPDTLLCHLAMSKNVSWVSTGSTTTSGSRWRERKATVGGLQQARGPFHFCQPYLLWNLLDLLAVLLFIHGLSNGKPCSRHATVASLLIQEDAVDMNAELSDQAGDLGRLILCRRRSAFHSGLQPTLLISEVIERGS